MGFILADRQLHITGFLICVLISCQPCVQTFGVSWNKTTTTSYLCALISGKQCVIIINISDSEVFPVGNLGFQMQQ